MHNITHSDHASILLAQHSRPTRHHHHLSRLPAQPLRTFISRPRRLPLTRHHSLQPNLPNVRLNLTTNRSRLKITHRRQLSTSLQHQRTRINRRVPHAARLRHVTSSLPTARNMRQLIPSLVRRPRQRITPMTLTRNVRLPARINHRYLPTFKSARLPNGIFSLNNRLIRTIKFNSMNKGTRPARLFPLNQTGATKPRRRRVKFRTRRTFSIRLTVAPRQQRKLGN